MKDVEGMRPGALPADYQLDYRTPDERLRDTIGDTLRAREETNEIGQAASLGEGGEIFLPASARPKILTCPCEVQVIAGSPAAAEHKRDHGKPR